MLFLWSGLLWRRSLGSGQKEATIYFNILYSSWQPRLRGFRVESGGEEEDLFSLSKLKMKKKQLASWQATRPEVQYLCMPRWTSGSWQGTRSVQTHCLVCMAARQQRMSVTSNTALRMCSTQKSWDNLRRQNLRSTYLENTKILRALAPQIWHDSLKN